MKTPSSFLPILALLAACSSGSAFNAADIDSGAPSVSIGGERFTAMGSRATRDDGELSVSLFMAPPEMACGFGLPEGDAVLFRVPSELGEYPLSLDFSSPETSRTLTFVDAPSDNIIASEGLIVVEAVSANSISIALIAEAGNETVNGRISVEICP